MYGFKPQHARGKPVQNFADGGIVHSIKGALGMRPRTQEELLADDARRMAKNREAAAAVAERSKPAPSAPQAQQNAVSGYAGMSVTQRREKELGLKDGGVVPRGFKPGGLIRGPGTGTSDSIEAEKKPGTFIMPADSTEAIGPEALEEMGETVPVRLSDGEFELPPEQVQALGEAVLTVMRNATHQPAGEAQKAPTSNGFMPAQHFASGGVVKDEEQQRMAKGRGPQQPNGFFPNNSPDAGADIYAGVGPANGFGSSGKLATGAEKVIAPQPPVQQPAVIQRPAAIQPRAPDVQGPPESAQIPVGGMRAVPPLQAQSAAPAPAPAQAVAPQASAPVPATQMEDQALAGLKRARGFQVPGSSGAMAIEDLIAGRRSSMQAGETLRGIGQGVASLFRKPEQAQPAAPAATNPTDARLAAGTQRTPAGFATTIKPQAPASASAPAAASAPVVVQRMAQPPQSPAFDFDNFQPAPGQGAFRNEQTGEVTRLQDGPAPIGTRTWKEPNVLPRSDARPAAQRQEVRAPVLNPNGGVFAAMADFTNQTGDAVNAIAANKGARNDRKDDLDQTRVDADIAATGARLSLDGQRVGLDAQRIAQGGDANRIASEELSMRREAAGFQTRAAKRLEDLQASYQSAKTPEERAGIAQQLRELQGKNAPAEWGVQVTPSIKNADGSTTEGSVYRYNKATGQTERVDGGRETAQALPPKDQLKAGQTYSTPRGPARWDGSQFIPV